MGSYSSTTIILSIGIDNLTNLGLSNAIGVSSAMANVASDAKLSDNSETAACLDSFSMIVENAAQNVFNRFTIRPQLFLSI